MSSTLGRLLSLAWPLRGWMLLSALLGALTVATSIGLMATAAFVIAAAALHPSIADLALAIVGVRFFGVARGLFRYLERYVSHTVTFRLLARLRVWFYQELEPLAPARMLQYRSGDLLSRAVADIETLQDLYIRVIAPPAVALAIGALMALFLGFFAPILAAALLTFFFLAGVSVSLLAYRLGRRPGQRLVRARAELDAEAIDSLQGMADLLAFGCKDRQLARMDSAGQRLLAAQEEQARVAGLSAGLTILLAGLCVWVILVLAVSLVSTGRMDGIYVPVLILAALAAFEAIFPLPLAFQSLGRCLEAGRRLFDIVNTQPAVQDPLLPSPQPRHYDLEVRDLRFIYGAGEAPALDGITFTLSAGGTVAIVGPSGAGKSTLVHLLLRFWEYEQGRIMLGGHDLRSYRRADLSRLIAVVSQRTLLFNGTIRDNLRIACPDTSDEDLLRVAKLAELDGLVRSLPGSFDTWIGEGGLKLSGGERQRLAIARALLRDAPVLILDEATAHLDSLTERAVLSSLQRLAEGRTTLIVTHQSAGLENVDEILTNRA